MAAAEGNKYAEKWTKETVMEKLLLMVESAAKEDCYYIGSALAEIGLYNQWYSEMAIKFKNDEDVSETIKKIDQLFEAKLVGKALKGDINPTITIFTLKNKHNWKDKSEVDSNNTHSVVWKEEKHYEANNETDQSS